MARKENKFEIEQVEERIAPSAVSGLLGSIGTISANVTGNDTVSASLPLLGNVSVGVNANDGVSISL